MDLRTAGSALLASASPTLTADLDAFRLARDDLTSAPRRPRTVAVVGLIPGAGRTTATALLARCVAGYTDRRVTVVDAATPPAAPHAPVNGRPALTDAAGRTVTAMLGGDVNQGRLATLLDAPPAPGVARSRVRSALTPGALPSVLSLPPALSGFAPQYLEQTLTRLRLRADLVVIDTPVGPAPRCCTRWWSWSTTSCWWSTARATRPRPLPRRGTGWWRRRGATDAGRRRRW